MLLNGEVIGQDAGRVVGIYTTAVWNNSAKVDEDWSLLKYISIFGRKQMEIHNKHYFFSTDRAVMNVMA